MKKKNFLIIGGAGFIGRSIIKKIDRKKINIHILDLRDQNRKYFKNKKSIHIYNGDICNKQVFDKLKKRFDKVFFLAAETSTYLCEQNPLKCTRTNIIGMLNFSEWCIETKPKEIIFTSSMAVYGLKAANIKETTKLNPISNYGISKLIGEKIILQLSKLKLKVKIFRLFNVYGPGQDYNNLNQGMLSIYLIQALKNKKVLIKGSTNRYRDFIFIEDVVDVLISNFKTGKNLIYNLGNGKKIIVKSLLKKIFKNLDLNYKVRDIGSHAGDTFGSYANINRINKKGFKLKYNLNDGLKKTIESLKGTNEYSRYFNR
jgi:UDP-glucose 4-epimerase